MTFDEYGHFMACVDRYCLICLTEEESIIGGGVEEPGDQDINQIPDAYKRGWLMEVSQGTLDRFVSSLEWWLNRSKLSDDMRKAARSMKPPNLDKFPRHMGGYDDRNHD